MKQKLKQILIVVALLSTYSYATCTKQELIKLIDKGFSKIEINSICDRQNKTTTTGKPKNKWITPSNSTCRSEGGILHKGICNTNWQRAKNICGASGGRLPSVQELIKVVTDCGGNKANLLISAQIENREDLNYQACYQRKGFIASDNYWSSSTDATNSNYAWLVAFDMGARYYNSKSDYGCVRCVKNGQ